MSPAPGLFCQGDLSKTKLRNTACKEHALGPLLHPSTRGPNTRSSRAVSLSSPRSWWGSVPRCPGKGEIPGLEFGHCLCAIYIFDTQSPRAEREVVKATSTFPLARREWPKKCLLRTCADNQLTGPKHPLQRGCRQSREQLQPPHSPARLLKKASQQEGGSSRAARTGSASPPPPS